MPKFFRKLRFGFVFPGFCGDHKVKGVDIHAAYFLLLTAIPVANIHNILLPSSYEVSGDFSDRSEVKLFSISVHSVKYACKDSLDVLF